VIDEGYMRSYLKDKSKDVLSIKSGQVQFGLDASSPNKSILSKIKYKKKSNKYK